MREYSPMLHDNIVRTDIVGSLIGVGFGSYIVHLPSALDLSLSTCQAVFTYPFPGAVNFRHKKSP